METSDIILWGGIGLVAYYLFGGTSTAAATATTTAAAAPSASVPASVPATPAMTQAQATLSMLEQLGPAPVLVAAKQATGGLPSGLLNMSQWNWYVHQVSGFQPPSIADYLPSGIDTMSITTYWPALMQWAQAQVAAAATAAATAAGMSGLGSIHQPGRGPSNSSNFPAPGNSVDGRFDFNEMGWM